MKDFITVTVDKATAKKGLININNIVFAEPFPTDANATTLYLSGTAGQQGGLQVVVDEPLETIISLIKQAQS
jgi:hypothetical protein